MFSQLKISLAVLLLIDSQQVIDVKEEILFQSVYLIGCVRFEYFGKGMVLQRRIVPDLRGLNEGYKDDVFPIVEGEFGFSEVGSFSAEEFFYVHVGQNGHLLLHFSCHNN